MFRLEASKKMKRKVNIIIMHTMCQVPYFLVFHPSEFKCALESSCVCIFPTVYISVQLPFCCRCVVSSCLAFFSFHLESQKEGNGNSWRCTSAVYSIGSYTDLVCLQTGKDVEDLVERGGYDVMLRGMLFTYTFYTMQRKRCCCIL